MDVRASLHFSATAEKEEETREYGHWARTQIHSNPELTEGDGVLRVFLVD
jgi:hypothetical protein